MDVPALRRPDRTLRRTRRIAARIPMVLLRDFAFPILALRILALPAAGLLAAPAAAQERPLAAQTLVRTVTARTTQIAADIVITGDVQAQAQTNVSFRTNGKKATRLGEVGDHVTSDQVLARLDPQEQRANLDNARAALTSAEALLTQAKLSFKRQESLLASGYTTRPAY